MPNPIPPMPKPALRPNPYSPYADAAGAVRHLFPSLFGIVPQATRLALTACKRMAVVPAEPLRDVDFDNPAPGLCRACVNTAIGRIAPERQEPQRCQACSEPSSHGRWCALCRQELHEQWWKNRSRMKAVTVYQPYAWAIGRAAVSPTGKPIENRPWPTRHRGFVAIHAGQKWDRDGAVDPRVQAEWSEYIRSVADRPQPGAGIEPAASEFVTGAIVAVANLVDMHHSVSCLRTSPLAKFHPDGRYTCSPWAVGGAGGMYHWELSNVHVLAEPVPCSGRQRFWDVPDDAVPLVLDQLGA